MKHSSPFFVSIYLFIATSITCFGTKVHDLKCEYFTNLIGIHEQAPRLSWRIKTEENNWLQSAYEIRVASSVKDLLKGKKLLWYTGKVQSDQSINVAYAGQALDSRQRVYWQVRVWGPNNVVSEWSDAAFWEMGLLKVDDWQASFIGTDDFTTKKKSHPSQFYRHEFKAKKKIQKARAYASALGVYELQINGQKVGKDVFTPGYTSYHHRLQYQVYDVTEMIEADNCVGAILGDGWYRGNIGWKGDYAYYGDQLGLLVQLEITYTDGSQEVIATNKNWKTSYGPILESDMYNGEKYDARKEMQGWSNAHFDESNWKSVMLIEKDKNILVPQVGPPVREIEEILPKEIITTPRGERVLDLGQNIVGYAKLRVNGPKGHKVTLKFAEVLDKDGNFYTKNLRSAEATDTYICKGEGTETYKPRFTTHGFRYIQVIDYPGELHKEDIIGIVVHSDIAPTGNFTTSNEMINQLQSNIQWGQKDNFLDIPTDCPQRDERAGWTGDAQVFSMTAAYNFDVAAFYTKWLKDFKVDQYENGAVPNVIPDILSDAKGIISKGGATGWADAAVIIPWSVYQSYGDKRILEEQYSSMKSWVDFMVKRAGDDHLWNDPKHWHWGDWLAYNADKPDYNGSVTEKDLIATAYMYYTTTLLSKTASVISEEADVNKYNALAERMKEAFAKEYITPNGRLVSHTQTAYALALSFGLIPDELIDKTAAYFAADVQKFGHLTTGFLGTPLLCSTLSKIGRDDLAFMLLNRKEFPSWLYPITMGATTIWERWDTQKPDGTIIEGMNSFNHYAYGAIGEWMYNYIGGLQIDPENPGYKHIIFHPHPGGGLTAANAELQTVYGKAQSSWEIKNGMFIYDIVIPPNTTASLVLPQIENAKLNGSSIANSSIIRQEGKKVIELGSGNYQLTWKI